MARREVPTRPVLGDLIAGVSVGCDPDPAGRRLCVPRRTAARHRSACCLRRSHRGLLLRVLALPVDRSGRDHLAAGAGWPERARRRGVGAVRRTRCAAGALRRRRAPRPRSLRRWCPCLPDVPAGPVGLHRSGRAPDPAVAGAGCRRSPSGQRPARTSGVRRPDRPEPVGAERGRLLGGHHRRHAPRAPAARDLSHRPDPRGRRRRRRLGHRCRRAGRRCGEHRWRPQPDRPAVVRLAPARRFRRSSSPWSASPSRPPSPASWRPRTDSTGARTASWCRRGSPTWRPGWRAATRWEARSPEAR